MQNFKSGKVWCLSLAAAALLSACVTGQPAPTPNPSPSTKPTASPSVSPSPKPTTSPSPSASPSQPATSLSQIGYGKSYGFCRGYCEHSLSVTATRMQLVHRAHSEPEKYPERVIEKPTPAATWQKLNSLASFSTLQSLPDRVGCPDCADGGAEWIEMQQGSNTKRVTFEPQDGLPQQAELLSELKKLYQELDPPVRAE